MKTKEKIELKAVELFNLHGISNVTLREVAKELGKSYGNITYYYSTKKKIVGALYQKYSEEMMQLSAQLFEQQTAASLLESILEAPRHTFDLSIKYLFLFKDYLELKRKFPELMVIVDQRNEQRKSYFLDLLGKLQKEGSLRTDLDKEALNYLMELSGVMRTFFFLRLEIADYQKEHLLKDYLLYVNQLLYPYLSAEGQVIYQTWKDKL